jgi:hypothetical protein
MYPRLKLHTDLDVLKHSPLVRGMVMALQYADENGGIGLTKSDAMNRKFVHWAAEHFEWPSYTAAELFEMNKVLNEDNMRPLWPVHDLLRYLKLMRRYKGALVSTKKGRALAEAPDAFFDLVAPVYLFQSVHDERVEERGDLLGNWDIFLNVINIEARTGCSLAHLVKTLYGWDEDDRYDPEYSNARFALSICVVRPLCWLGLLWEDRTGLGFFGDGTFYKTPLWGASLKLETDAEAGLRLV